ncbi:protein of unknown function [Pseudorhizobium banfieldiae]|uniref:Uncharacterized protein n=1 Tax=Pseudorhizobium banfieldiae TaxID=1125847 RepID=L0NBW8_9HYPH|nr:SARP family transcriptional regulator [arsenite-oxidising bacterium NT-25]CCF18286.1 protein of unknown function [Pseudorhizobium banfieldiae]
MHRPEGMRARYRLYLLGSFALTDRTGRSLAPKSQKAQALLAMLALARRGLPSRVWLRDKLWSDRSEEHAFANLRQTLLEIRKTLGSARALVQADKLSVWLDLEQVELDLQQTTAWERANDQLLEGIDVRDPEFEEWLRLERQIWQTGLRRVGGPAMLDRGDAAGSSGELRREHRRATSLPHMEKVHRG